MHLYIKQIPNVSTKGLLVQFYIYYCLTLNRHNQRKIFIYTLTKTHTTCRNPCFAFHVPHVCVLKIPRPSIQDQRPFLGRGVAWESYMGWQLQHLLYLDPCSSLDRSFHGVSVTHRRGDINIRKTSNTKLVEVTRNAPCPIYIEITLIITSIALASVVTCTFPTILESLGGSRD